MWISANARRTALFGLASLVALLVPYAIALAIEGAPAGTLDGSERWSQEGRFNVVLAIVIAFTVGVTSGEAREQKRDIALLAPILELRPAEVSGLALPHPRGPIWWVAAIAGAVAGVGLILAGNTGGRAIFVEVHDFVRAAFMAILFSMLAVRGVESILSAQLFARLGLDHTRVDLFDPEPRKAFARPGLRRSLGWLIGSALASLLVIDTGATHIVGGVIVVTLMLGLASLLLPMRGIHAAVGAAKQAEVVRVREILGKVATGTHPRPPEDLSLADLIAYEGRVERIREWPVDAPTLLRFAVVAVLAIGSWVGGALVERFLSGLIG